MSASQHQNQWQAAPAIEMRGVSAANSADPDLVAIENVDWTAVAGDFWVVAGLHDSGRSDFLMTAAGLAAPAAGDYRTFGAKMPIFQESRLPERLRIGYVFESGHLFSHLTVYENVALPLRYHRNLDLSEAYDETERLLEATELTPMAERMPVSLAPSWQRRVGLARALILRPSLLFLDNPLAGLDLRHELWWLDFLSRIAGKPQHADSPPLTLVATTGDLRPWVGHAEQFAMLKNRGFVKLGGADRIESADPELLRGLPPAAEKPQEETPPNPEIPQ